MKIDAQLDVIYDVIDILIKSDKFKAVDSLLDANWGRFSIDISLGLLTTTLCIKSKLRNRENFFKKVKAALIKSGEDAEYVLRGLE